MRRGRIILYLALIIIVGVVGAAVVLLRQQQSAPAPNAQATPTPEVVTTNVVVIVQPVSRGQEITVDMVGMVPLPEDLVIQGWITDPAAVVGKRAKFDLSPGTVLNEGLLTQSLAELSATGSEAALQIPPGMVAVAIPIDRLSSVAYGVRDGDHVNVIVTVLFSDLDAEFQSRLPNTTASVQGPSSGAEGTSPPVLTAQIQAGGPLGPVVGRASLDSTLAVPIYQQPSEPQRPRMVSQMLLQDVIVLHVGNFEEKQAAAVATPTPVPGEGEAQPAPSPQATPTAQASLPPDIITLIVTPQDALTLNWLMMQGARLSLALRAANDASRVQTEAVTLQYLTSAYSIPVPAKLPFGLEPRVDELVPPVLPNDQQQQQGP